MPVETPHYLLFSEASQNPCAAHSWRFVLQNVDSQRRFSASDHEPLESGSERLELLAVVRGLEALDQPARVTLVTKSRYVSRGIKQGLAEWRANGWNWEHFGRIVPVRDDDLWRRVDRALRYHDVNCQAWQFNDQQSEQESQVENSDCQAPANEAERCRRNARRPVPVRRPQRDAGSRLTRGWHRSAERKLGQRVSETWQAMVRPMRQALGATA